jgi:hypothetical protein
MGDVFKGDERAPKTERSLEQIRLGLNRQLPGINRNINREILPTERSLLTARQEIAPQEQELQTGLFEQFAPRYAQAELNNLRGAGGQAVIEADQINEMLKRIADPEFFQTRANTSRRVNELLDAGGNLTGGQMSSVERGLNRQFQGRGTGQLPTNSQQLQSAQAYGGQSRQNLNQSLGIALGSLPQFQARGNTNVLGQSQGTTARFNPAGTGFSGDVGGTSAALGSQVLGGAQAQQLGKQQIDANRRSVSDHVNEAYSSAISVCGWTTTEAFYGRVPWYVRTIRDHYYESDPTIAKGYLRMCRVVVPLMRASALFRDLILEVMIKPLTAYGGYITATKGYEHGKHKAGILKFWLKTWKFLGKY